MGHDHTSTTKLTNPGPLQASGGVRGLFLACIVLGVALFAVGLSVDARRTWASFVLNHFFFLSLGLGGIFFAAIQWLTGSMWSAPVRRVSESFTAYLPAAMVFFGILYFGIHHVFEWSHPEHVRGDLILEGKVAYLNIPFFLIRNFVAFGLWIFFAKKMIGNSVAQDASGDIKYTDKNRVLAPGFLILFAITFTMASFDLLMSLDPHWFSTMFGVYTFSGLFYSTLALICILTIVLRRQGALKNFVNENHLHDLGKLMFAFTVFWAYIGFSQFMLIWYANMPEETGYFMTRMQGGWLYVSIFLLVGKFMAPFFLLLRRENKRSEGRLLFVGVWMLASQWIDLLWLVQPEFFREGPRVSWYELGVFIGFMGVFGSLVLRFLSKNSVVAIGDPKLSTAVFHHHQ